MHNESLLFYLNRTPESLILSPDPVFLFYSSLRSYREKSKAYLAYKLFLLLQTPDTDLTKPKKFKKQINKIAKFIDAQLEYLEKNYRIASTEFDLNVIEMCSVALDVVEKIHIYFKEPSQNDCYENIIDIYTALIKGFTQIKYYNVSFIDMPMFSKSLKKEVSLYRNEARKKLFKYLKAKQKEFSAARSDTSENDPSSEPKEDIPLTPYFPPEIAF